MLWGRDIDNADWELDKRTVALVVTPAAALVRKHCNMREGFHFSIAKGSLRLFGPGRYCHRKTFPYLHITGGNILVNLDLHRNTLFAVWGIVLEQGKRGVPIGGYISTQLMCIWALIQEHAFFEDPTKELLMKNVQTMWPKNWTMPEIKPGPTLTFPEPAWVPRDPDVLHAHGMAHGMRIELSFATCASRLTNVTSPLIPPHHTLGQLRVPHRVYQCRLLKTLHRRTRT